MRILLTNDDGVDAEGFAALKRIAAELSDDVWTCAPEVEQSGASRGITLTAPLRVRKLGERDWAVSGTPTDCVILAVNDLMASPPDLVLSGVNRGQNLAEDVTFSGTVAGALQGMALGIPSIALSQAIRLFRDWVPVRFDTAMAHGAPVLSKLIEAGWPKGVILNINFPDCDAEAVTAVEVTSQGARDVANNHAERRTDLRGRDYYWMGFAKDQTRPADGTDLAAIYENRISVTPLHVDMTHQPSVHDLKRVLGGAPPKRVTVKAGT
jgi:5'-nucleotidase